MFEARDVPTLYRIMGGLPQIIHLFYRGLKA
jgi:hypothetical protein